MARLRVILVAFLLAAGLLGTHTLAHAAVVIVANRTDRPVRFTLQPGQGKAEEYTLEANDLVTIPVVSEVTLTLSSGTAARRYPLGPNSAHSISNLAGGLSLQQITITNPPDKPPVPDKEPAPGKPAEKLVIPVKILVDEDEPLVRRIWEERLRKRLQAASDIIERQCRVRFEVVAVETWESDNKITDFRELHQEFERKVKPGTARVAIGFTSQLQNPQGPTHLGVTRTVLHTHMLIREGFRTEPERLEVLVHELGHFLGAAHSADGDSVMRPKLADGKATAAKFRIGFDPLNALAISLVAEELRTRKVGSLRELSPATREQVARIYGEIARALPDDPAAAELLRQLELPATAPRPADPDGRLSDNTRRIVAAVVRAAERNHRLPARGSGEGPFRLTGDELTDLYIREAAAAARGLPEKQAVQAFLLGIGIAIDSSDLLRKNPATRGLVVAVENDDERRHRLGVLGLPTMHGRHDLAQHFVVSGALAALIGPALAETAGLLKEQLDMQPGGSGFSFADLCANVAGVSFATLLRQKGTIPADLAATFALGAYMPDPSGLREGLSQEAFARHYGSISDERFQAEQLAILKRVLALPGYKTAPK